MKRKMADLPEKFLVNVTLSIKLFGEQHKFLVAIFLSGKEETEGNT